MLLKTKTLTLVLAITFAGLYGHAQDSRGVTRTASRVALVIGNERYPACPLRTAANDSKQIAAALQNLGFAVHLAINADRRDLERQIDGLIAGIAKGNVVVVYYSGHGIQIADENYLVPVDFTASDAVDAKYNSYSAARLIDRVEAKAPDIFLVVLDASHDNSFRFGDSVKVGLAPMDAGTRALVALSAAPGKKSVDLAGSSTGLFAGFLLDALRMPGLTIDQIFSQVRSKVYEATKGEQLPVVSTGADSSLVLFTKPEHVSPTDLPDQTFEKELREWSAVQDKADEKSLRDFISAYPNGAFADSAGSRLQSMFIKAVPSTKREDLPSNDIVGAKEIKLPEHEVDPNFAFTDIEWELLAQVNALDRRFEREGMIYHDSELQDYLDRVGRSILPSSVPPPNVKWRFLAIRDPIPNAFALPNGSVYVNTGLLAVLENESQLASVMAHEITHVTGRHGYRENRDYRRKALTASLFQMAGNYAPVNTAWGQSLQMAAVAVPAIMQNLILGFDREMEREADLYALDKLRNTGYDPREMANAFRLLQENHEVELQKTFYTDHPKLQDRIDYVKEYLAKNKVDDSGLFVAQAAQYQAKTASAVRADILLAIASQRRRTAYWIAKGLAARVPKSADNILALADAYRGLGPWSPEPQPEELTSDAKKKLAKARVKLTPMEEEARLRSTPEAKANLRENARHAEELYTEALAMDPSRVTAYKSLAMVYEGIGDTDRAKQAYGQYLSLAPQSDDADYIRRKLAAPDFGLQRHNTTKGDNR
jgi:predicted Zn-dependent protease